MAPASTTPPPPVTPSYPQRPTDVTYAALRGPHVNVLHQFAVDFRLILPTGGVALDVRLRRQVEHGRKQSPLRFI